jgi:hypothetical protein
MRFRFNIDDKLDLSEFKRVFFISEGIAQATFHLHFCNIKFTIDVHPIDGKKPQQVSIGLSDVLGAYYEIKHIFPLNDIRFKHLPLFQQIFEHESNHWGHLTCSSAQETFDSIEKLLRDTQRILKLKAFL